VLKQQLEDTIVEHGKDITQPLVSDYSQILVTMECAESRTILVVENSPEQIDSIQTLLKQNSAHYQVVAIADAKQALDYVHHRESYRDASRPDLILLDLNVSGDGRELLADIKTNLRTRRIPVIVLTAFAEIDILLSYSLQGNCYIVRSDNREQLAEIIQRIEEFWLGIVTLPIE
jgi:chemotaxis family two-component system response regulator Rcp1